MSCLDILLLAIGLSMDSLAVSVACGAIIRKYLLKVVFKIAFILAFFQASFTLIGYLLGFGFLRWIEAFDHWIAFFLLLYLGVGMILESMKDKEEEKKINSLRLKTLCGLGVATSIDALAVGVSLAVLRISVSLVLWIVGIVTFLFSAIGIYIGVVAGNKIGSKLDLIGGLILIGIGIKILMEDLYFA